MQAPQPASLRTTPNRRGRLTIYALELSIGTVAGLALFLVLLWLLQWTFPDATSFGDLVRSRGTPERPRAALSGDSPATLAVLSAVRHDVRDKPSSSVVWSVAQRGAELAEGDAVQSYGASGATITFDAHNALELGEKSLIVLRKLHPVEGSARRRASILFMDGFLRGTLGGGSAPLELEVLAAGSTVRPRYPDGEPIEIAMAFDKTTSMVAVQDGDAEVVWHDQVTVVPAGHMVTVDPAHGPGRPVPLPQPPVLASPADGEIFRFRATPPRVAFAWRADDDTPEFSLQIARDRGFKQVIFERRQPQPSLVHGALAAGEYYWRVVGRHGPIEGQASAAARFTIEATRQPPALSLEPPMPDPAGRTVVLRGATEPGCRVIVGELDVPTDALGHFEHTLDLREGYNFIVVQAVDALGNTAFENRTIVAGPVDTTRNP